LANFQYFNPRGNLSSIHIDKKVQNVQWKIKWPVFSLIEKIPDMDSLYCCHECLRPISIGVYNFSMEVFCLPLCLKHQSWITESKASPEAISLYFALKSNNLPVELEFWDGHKTIDIAIPGKLHIEVDDSYQEDADQVVADFLESIHTWKDHIPTFRVSNNHVRNTYHFAIIVDSLTELCEEFKKTG
jgi:hypothetical protein